MTRFSTFFTRSDWMPLDSPTCFKQLQHLEQEGAVQPDLSSFGKKICMYGHTDEQVFYDRFLYGKFYLPSAQILYDKFLVF